MPGAIAGRRQRVVDRHALELRLGLVDEVGVVDFGRGNAIGMGGETVAALGEPVAVAVAPIHERLGSVGSAPVFLVGDHAMDLAAGAGVEHSAFVAPQAVEHRIGQEADLAAAEGGAKEAADAGRRADRASGHRPLDIAEGELGVLGVLLTFFTLGGGADCRRGAGPGIDGGGRGHVLELPPGQVGVLHVGRLLGLLHETLDVPAMIIKDQQLRDVGILHDRERAGREQIVAGRA